MSVSGTPLVVGVVGLSYCGSTLLNCMLDRHPAIYGGGELHWLIARKQRRVEFPVECTQCGPACGYWTTDVKDSVSLGDLHATAARLFQVPFVVDTSKEWSWFESVREHSAGRLKFCQVLLAKHPIRHLASFLVNRPQLGRFFQAGTMKLGVVSRVRRQAAIGSAIRHLRRSYAEKLNRVGRGAHGSFFTLMHYEHLVTDTAAALGPVLDYLKLAFDPAMCDPYGQPHHQIGGNAGTLFPAVGRWLWSGGGQAVHPLRRHQYEGLEKRVFVDMKYRTVFSERELKRLQCDPRIAELCRLLGYSPAIDQTDECEQQLAA